MHGESNGRPEDRKALLSDPLLSVVNKVLFQNQPFQLNVAFYVYNRDEYTSIYLSLSDDMERDALISGFPQCLLRRDTAPEGEVDDPRL